MDLNKGYREKRKKISMMDKAGRISRRNPVLSLVGYDALKNLQVPRVEKPTRTGRVSAGT